MPDYDIYAGITHNHTVEAATPEEAFDSGPAEAADCLIEHFGIAGYDRNDLVVFDSVLDLDERGPEGGNLYMLTAVLSFDFPIAAADAYEAEEGACGSVRKMAAGYGIIGLSDSDISVWGVTEQ